VTCVCAYHGGEDRPPILKARVGPTEVTLPPCPVDRPGECRLIFGPVSSTGLPRRFVIDRRGNNTVPDPNTYTCIAGCERCGASWRLTATADDDSVQVLAEGEAP
jgi:hypothetical protein